MSQARKRSSRSKEEGPDKKKSAIIACCYSDCQRPAVISSDPSVEVKTGIPTRYKRDGALCLWSLKGEAVFHRHCWDNLLKNARIRNIKKATIPLTVQEKGMIKEASKTAEYHDSEDAIDRYCDIIVDRINKADHCVVFTGAGISTSAGIGLLHIQ